MILDGKSLKKKSTNLLKSEIEKLEDTLRLDIIQVGENEASKRYVRNKVKMAEAIGVNCEVHWLNEDITEKKLLKLIKDLNKDDSVNGIIVQLPLPNHIDFENVRNAVSPLKDVDGFSNGNIGNLVNGKKCLVPCTALGIIKLLDEYNIDLEGKNVAIIGRSLHIGLSLFHLFTNRNSTVTVCHSKTKNLSDILKRSDIIVTAVGKVKFITSDMISDDCILVDVGINFDETGKMCGDVDYANVSEKCSYITPVPGGVGPMTVTCIYHNLIDAYYMQKKVSKK